MGVCYSQQQQWEAYKHSHKTRRKLGKRNKTSSIIYQENSVHESSFASNLYASFREDLHQTISSLAHENGEVFMGSVVEMKEGELDILYKSLHKINMMGERHDLNENLILCNLKTKNYLHTHKIKLPESKLFNEVSCCPYNSNHIPEYDIWKFIKAEEAEVAEPAEDSVMKNQEENEPLPNQQGNQTVIVYIYHPFTQRFLAYQKGIVVASENKVAWKVQSFGPRRNGGFLKISLLSGQGELCMSEQKGLLEKHRKVEICSQKHISHIWQLMFIDPDLI